MVKKKNLRQKLIYSLLLTSLLLATSVAQQVRADVQWQSLTSLREINRFLVVGDSLYCATSGGLLAIGDAGEPGRIYDNLSGLGTAHLTDIILDQSSRLFTCGAGRIVRLDQSAPRQYLLLDNESSPYLAHSLTDDNDFLWVGTELGLLLFAKEIDGGQIQDSYTMFGDLNPSPDVYQVFLVGDSIWLATSEGLAVADRTSPNQLKSPSAWDTFSPGNFPQLGGGQVNRIALFENEIYLATDNGLFKLGRAPDTLMRVSGAFGRCTDLVVEGTTLQAYCGNGLVSLSGGTVDSVYAFAELDEVATHGLLWNNQRWVGAADRGVFYRTSGLFQNYPFTGAPANNASALGINSSGQITAGFQQEPVGQYADSLWSDRAVAMSSRSMDVMIDSSGHAWVGTFGIGVWHLTPDTAINYNATNSSLKGNSDGAPGALYVVIRGLDTDGTYLFAAAYRALDGNPIAVAKMNDLDNISAWTSFGIDDGINDELVSTLDYQDGYLAVGTDAGGVYLCYIGPDPFDRSDDYCVHYTAADDRLLSNTIRQVHFDPDGVLWVATNFGLSRWNRGYEWFDDVDLPAGFGPNIDDIAFDSRGNLWASSLDGLLFLNVTTGASDHYTTINSGLISDRVTDIAFDNYSGRLLVSTANGLSIVTTEAGQPRFETSAGLPFPNPFIIRSADDKLRFTYARSGMVRIFTVAGELIIEQSVNIEWDGRNQAGRQVASGVYFYIFTDIEGRQDQGKFLLVRE